MNHAITIGGLLLGLGCIAGLLMLAFGALAAFASGMSDSVEAGSSAGRMGCKFGLFGAVLLIGSIWGLLS